MVNRKQYIKPQVLNLSGFGVVGQEPLGWCSTGHEPSVANCFNGTDVTQSEFACSPTGFGPEFGDCNPNGGNVMNICTTGSLHT